ncbi:MAG TPA: Rieske (2Fe-2S) protein [Parachlamydiaceae bacterium]|nr:Rieske (2Fe-2S) protein [Parachlamydiaceae bacterium]
MNEKPVKLANVDDIPVGKAIIVTIADGMEIALFNVEGKIFALENVCPHMGGPLGEGELKGDVVTCPWHDWQFDVKTGICINMPGDDSRSLPIEVRGNEIFLA